VLELALPNQVFDGSCNVFDRHDRAGTMLIEQIDGIDPESIERGLSDPAFEGSADNSDHFLLGRTITEAHSHAAKSDR